MTDMMYMSMVYFGIGRFMDSPLLQIILWSFGCFVLLYTGIETIIALNKTKEPTKTMKKHRLRTTMMAGFVMSLFNPLTILFWLGIYGSILAKSAGVSTTFQLILFSFAILAGIMMVDFMMSLLSNGARRLLSSRWLKGVSLVSSMSMIGFGLYFGSQAYQALF